MLLRYSFRRTRYNAFMESLMRLLTSLWLLLLLSGCVSYSGTSRPPDKMIVVPPGSTVYCSDGSAPPCR